MAEVTRARPRQLGGYEVLLLTISLGILWVTGCDVCFLGGKLNVQLNALVGQCQETKLQGQWS